MSLLLKTALKVCPIAYATIYVGICTAGTLIMNKKEGLDLNPIDIMKAGIQEIFE